MADTDTARVLRARRHAAWSRRLDRALHDCASEERLAADLGCSRTTLHKYRDAEDPRTLPLADVEALPPTVRRELVATLAESLGCTLSDTPDAVDVSSDVRLLAEVARETAEAVAAWADALADGHLTAAEAATVEREAAEAMAALGALRERARLATAERVIGLRVVG